MGGVGAGGRVGWGRVWVRWGRGRWVGWGVSAGSPRTRGARACDGTSLAPEQGEQDDEVGEDGRGRSDARCDGVGIEQVAAHARGGRRARWAGSAWQQRRMD